MRPEFPPYDCLASRTCRRCSLEKNVDQFPFIKRNGKPGARCFSCIAAVQRERWANRVRVPYVRPNAWTAADDEKLSQMVLDGNASCECAAALGRTVNAVRQRRLKQRLPWFARSSRHATAWPPERIAQLRKLYAEGRTYAEMAKTLNTTRGAIAHAVAYHVKKTECPDAKPLPDVWPASRPARNPRLQAPSLPEVQYRIPRRAGG